MSFGGFKYFKPSLGQCVCAALGYFKENLTLCLHFLLNQRIYFSVGGGRYLKLTLQTCVPQNSDNSSGGTSNHVEHSQIWGKRTTIDLFIFN
jgi:hypothetical protein